MYSVTVPVLPEEFLNFPTEKVVETLIKNPDKITELFGEKIGTFLRASLSDKSMTSTISETLLYLVAFSQRCTQLDIELEKMEEEPADYFSTGFPT